jgi:putative hydrolase of HD superfamily
MFMHNLPALLDFVSLTNEYGAVERTIRKQKSEAWENDLEHASQLALVAWYLLSKHCQSLSLEKVLRYALMHDIVEVYAGDVYVYDTNPQVHLEKKERENNKARQKLTERFPDFPDLSETLRAYENQDDAESRFVYALDKLLPVINIYLDNGRTWREKELTLEIIEKTKREKIGDTEPLRTYFELLIETMHTEKERLF